MKMSRLMCVAMFGMSLVGCRSLDDQLMSYDPATREEAETELVDNALKVDDPATLEQTVARISNDKLLARIAISAHRQGLLHGEMVDNTISAGLCAVAKIRSKAYLFEVEESARETTIRNAAKATR